MRNSLGAAVVIAGLCTSAGAAAQDQIQWKQVSNMAIGANLPPGVKGDLLGIELGAPYAAVRPVLKALVAEGLPQAAQQDPATAKMLGQDASAPMEEIMVGIRLPRPGGGDIKATYLGTVILKREIKGKGAGTISEEIRVRFSGPSSGHQVLSVYRFINYVEHSDQVRISELVKSIGTKFRSTPRVTKASGSTSLKISFDNGQMNIMEKYSSEDIRCAATIMDSYDQDRVREMNESGRCDVILQVEFTHGISDDHASSITFTLTDVERTKANLSADYAFFDSYIDDLRKRTSGAAPKL